MHESWESYCAKILHAFLNSPSLYAKFATVHGQRLVNNRHILVRNDSNTDSQNTDKLTVLAYFRLLAWFRRKFWFFGFMINKVWNRSPQDVDVLAVLDLWSPRSRPKSRRGRPSFRQRPSWWATSWDTKEWSQNGNKEFRNSRRRGSSKSQKCLYFLVLVFSYFQNEKLGLKIENEILGIHPKYISIIQPIRTIWLWKAIPFWFCIYFLLSISLSNFSVWFAAISILLWVR